jgi:hypothetical protein
LDRRQLIKRLQQGTKIVLVPEPDNPYDRNAILLYNADDLENDIGYLDSTGAKQICGLIERGATLSAEVFYVWYKNPNSPYVRIMIWQLTPALQSHRPIRKGAPVYKPASRFPAEGDEPVRVQPKSERVEIRTTNKRVVETQPTIEPVAVQLTQLESDGIWSY